MTSFGERLKSLRVSKNLSQMDVAKLIKTSKSSINMYERNEREPGIETVIALADLFGVDLDYLLGRSKRTNSNKQYPYTESIRIRELRQSKGISMKEASRLLGMPYTTYVNYEKGLREPTTEGWIQLAKFFGVSVDFLMGRKCENNHLVSFDQRVRQSETIGDRIKSRRIALGLTVDQVAEKIGKNRSTVYRYESNDIEKLTIDILSPLADILQTTPTYLVGWTTSAYPNEREFLQIGERIRIARKTAGLTQRELADKVHVLHTSVCNWEKGISKPNFDAIHDLCCILCVEPNFFFQGTPQCTPVQLPSENKNVIRLIERDGSYQERILSDQQLAALKAVLDQMPDVPEDL